MKTGSLTCQSPARHRFAISRFVGRFVDAAKYADSFSRQPLYVRKHFRYYEANSRKVSANRWRVLTVAHESPAVVRLLRGEPGSPLVDPRPARGLAFQLGDSRRGTSAGSALLGCASWATSTTCRRPTRARVAATDDRDRPQRLTTPALALL